MSWALLTDVGSMVTEAQSQTSFMEVHLTWLMTCHGSMTWL